MIYNETVKIKKLKFNVIFQQTEDNVVLATVPSLPGCVSFGKDLREAREMIADAIEGYLVSMRKHNEKIIGDEEPVVSSVEVSMPAYV